MTKAKQKVDIGAQLLASVREMKAGMRSPYKVCEMNEHLVTIQLLVDAYGSEAEARWFRSLVRTYKQNRAEFWRQFGTNEVWGGSGSFLDQFMISPAGRDMDNFLADQRLFHRAMAALASEMAAAGHDNPQINAWATAIEGQAK